MKLKRLTAVARKETLHILRDPRALGISIALPLLLLLLFGYALTLDVDRIPFAALDFSHSVQSRELLSRFDNSRYFSRVMTAKDDREIAQALNEGRIQLALKLPPDFGECLASRRSTQIQLLADGSDSNTTSIALNYAEVIIQGYSDGILLKRAAQMSGRGPQPVLDLRTRIWFNPEMESRLFIVPGLIAVIMMLIAALLTSLTIAREWETGTLEPLITTPIQGSELMLGKLAPYFVIGMLDMALSVLAGRFLFDVPLKGSLLWLTVLSAIYLAGGLGMGIFISVKAKHQLLASQFAFVATFLPAFLLSGFMFDISNMPKPLQMVTYLVPAKYFVAILRDLYLKGSGIQAFWIDALLLLVFALLMLGLSIKSFKKQVI